MRRSESVFISRDFSINIYDFFVLPARNKNLNRDSKSTNTNKKY